MNYNKLFVLLSINIISLALKLQLVGYSISLVGLNLYREYKRDPSDLWLRLVRLVAAYPAGDPRAKSLLRELVSGQRSPLGLFAYICCGVAIQGACPAVYIEVLLE